MLEINNNKNVMVVAINNDTDDMKSKNGEKTVTLLFKKYSSDETEEATLSKKIDDSSVVLEAELFLDSDKLVICSGKKEENELGEFCYRDNSVDEKSVKKAVDAFKYAFLSEISDDKSIISKSFYEVLSNDCEVFKYDCNFNIDAFDKLSELFNRYMITFISLKEQIEEEEFNGNIKSWTYWKNTGDKKIEID